MIELIPDVRMRRLVARLQEVRGPVAKEGKRRQAEAAAVLAAARDSGNSRITGRRGRTDYNIELDDDRGQSAAISIEYGRTAMPGKKGSRPVGALAAAMSGGGEETDITP